MPSRYFSTLSAITLGLTLWGFSDNLVWNVGQRSNADPKFVVHGLFCLAWMVAFFVQARLVRTGRVATHRRWGVFAFCAAIGVTLSTLVVFVATTKGWSTMPFHIKANRLLLPGYALLVALAWVQRRRPDRHKRLLVVATLFMLEPVLSRAFDPLDGWLPALPEATVDTAWWVFAVVLWNGLFASLFAYDRRTLGKVHAVTLGGYTAFLAIFAVCAVL